MGPSLGLREFGRFPGPDLPQRLTLPEEGEPWGESLGLGGEVGGAGDGEGQGTKTVSHIVQHMLQPEKVEPCGEVWDRGLVGEICAWGAARGGMPGGLKRGEGYEQSQHALLPDNN